MSYDPVSAKRAISHCVSSSEFRVEGHAELPGPVNFDAAFENVTSRICRTVSQLDPDPQVHIEADEKSWMPASTGLRRPRRRRQKMVLQFWADELAPELALLWAPHVSPRM